MRVSSRADYGVRALFDLTHRRGHGPTQSRDIARRQAVPEAYLHQVLSALRRAGMIRSSRGPQGGHELAVDPNHLNLYDVLLVLDGPDQRGHPHLEGASGRDVVHEVWHDLEQQSIRFLQSITLQDLVEREQERLFHADYAI